MQQRLLDTVRHGFASRDQTRWALVIGDLMLDRYLIGEVERISPEAPVPVVLLKQQDERAGGAANVAANLAKLGITTRLAGYVGNDADGRLLITLINGMEIDTQAIVQSEAHPTITKTRIVGGHQQMMRLDQENRSSYSAADKKQIEQLIQAQLKDRPAVIVLSDYAKGVVEAPLTGFVIEEARKHGIPVLVDPKGRDFSKYKGATALTPNKRETAEAGNIDPKDNEALIATAQKLRAQLHLEFLAVTRGEEGISLFEAGEVQHIPATAKQVFDVSGAGDTVIATLAAGLMHGLGHGEALHLANIAAGVVVGKVGTVPITHQELLHALMSQEAVSQADKVCDLPSLQSRVEQWRTRGERIVFTNGCFDLLHAGHVTYLESARRAGDRLVLGLNTDRSVKALKGPTRPVIHEADRARVLAALEAVDAVILFDEDTPLELIQTIRPDVIAKGSDYTEAQVVGAAEVKSWGGKVALIPIVPGRSTTGILEKLVS